MLDHVQFSQPNLSICQALVAFATNHSRASQVRLLGGSKRTWFDHFLPKFGRLLISESTASNFWMSFLQFWHGFVWTWGTPEFNGFIDDLQFSSLSRKKKHMGRASCAAYSLRLHKRSSHLLKSSQIIQFRFPSFLDKILVLFQFCCFFSLGSTFTCGTPMVSPRHISARPVQHTGAWRERRGRWVRDDLMDVLAQDARVSAPRQGGMPCLDVHWSNIEQHEIQMLNSSDRKAVALEADFQQFFNFLVHRKMEDQLQGSS